MKTTLAAATLAAILAVPTTAAAEGCMWGAGYTPVASHSVTTDFVATHGADTVAVGDLHLFNRRTLETPPNARNAGGFLSVYNYASEPNRIVSASSPIAERVELHTMTMEDDVMRMRELEDGIELPGETQVDLQPGGLHVMFMNISGPFVEGDEVPVTLTFESGESQGILLPVRARSMDMNHGEMNHGEMDHSGHDHSGHDHSSHDH